MISNAILLVVNSFITILLAPLQVVNITINIVSSIPVLQNFLQVVGYLLPLNNLKPLIFGIISVAYFSIYVAVALFVVKLTKIFR